MTVIDSHVHAWNPETAETPWRSGWRSFAPRPSLKVPQLLAEMDAAEVDRAALIPPEWDPTANELALEAAARHPSRILAFPAISLRNPNSSEILQDWVHFPGFGGLRQIFLQSPGFAPLTDGSAEWLWPVAQDHGIRIMVWAPSQLSAFLEIAQRFPGIPFALDHVNLGMQASLEALLANVAALCLVADRANLAVKVSALPAAAPDPYPFSSVRGAMRRLVDAFGPQRIFWGSDFARLPCTYDESRTMMRAMGLDQPELQAVMGDSFAAWTGWGHNVANPPTARGPETSAAPSIRK